MDTAFMQARAAIAPCSSMPELQSAWVGVQAFIRGLPVEQRAALTAMKEFYKGMIQKGTIHAYLKARDAASKRQWTGAEVIEGPTNPRHNPQPKRKRR